jgi:septum formation protein
VKVILASASPRRAEVLADAGIPFEAIPAEIDEARLPAETVDSMVRRLANAKACNVAARVGRLSQPAFVIGADTAVELDGEVFGKPDSPAAARAMLQRLSGQTHGVLTAVAVIRLPDRAVRTAVERTEVYFAQLTTDEIEQYVASGEPFDKAGAYGIQGFGGRFVERIDGSYFNVVGLPLATVYRILKELGWCRAG